ncbi:hypothetical protein F6X40_09770 [Paraburkholderia sp. UCT31]|uniref:hypothetical protein n=1 Tax=Paraburkholderia sp. UCT31 TaxID=2615209 RepID=UPI001654DF44|nr:hypothetical protein [Paraburkholderia sp. UCT31]MBC8737095.1 hypothetical protein [Paraburkholderia sp. UCT31]
MRTDQWHFPRPELASGYLELLELGLSSARTLFARRRMGKTEFLQKDLAPAAERAGYLTAYVNLWEDRDEPAGALVGALYTALEPDWLARLMNKARSPLKRLKASGRLTGVGEGSIEAELTPEEKHYVGTLLGEVMRALDKQPKVLLLVIDEAQVLARLEHANFAHALRAALDIRKDKLKVVFAGSSESTLRNMFGRPAEPFYNWAALEPFPLLGREFVEFMIEKTNAIAKNQLSVKHGMLAFERLNQTPEFFRRFLERFLTYPFDGPQAAIEYTREHVFHDGHFARHWQSLLPADRAILTMMANGESDFHSAAAREKLGLILGLDKAPSMNTPAHALRRLQNGNLVTKLALGEYQFEDEAFGEWVRNLDLEAGSPK